MLVPFIPTDENGELTKEELAIPIVVKTIAEQNSRKSNEKKDLTYESAIQNQTEYLFLKSIDCKWSGGFVVQGGVRLPYNFPVDTYIRLWFIGNGAIVNQTITDGAENPFDLQPYFSLRIYDGYVVLYRLNPTPQLEFISVFCQGIQGNALYIPD